MTPRAPYTRRTYVVNCTVCRRWSPVPDLRTQQVCKEAGACLDCLRSDYHALRIRIIALEDVLAWLVKKGRKSPEDQKPRLRTIYTRKAQQLQSAREQLVALEASRTPPGYGGPS